MFGFEALMKKHYEHCEKVKAYSRVVKAIDEMTADANEPATQEEREKE